MKEEINNIKILTRHQTLIQMIHWEFYVFKYTWALWRGLDWHKRVKGPQILESRRITYAEIKPGFWKILTYDLTRQ